MKVLFNAAFGVLALALTACASGGEPQIPIAEAARADCEQRQTPPESMEACVEEATVAIRVARERLEAPIPQPRRRPTLTR